MRAIAREAREQPELLRSAPHTSPGGRLDEVRAARHPVLCDPCAESKGAAVPAA